VRIDLFAFLFGDILAVRAVDLYAIYGAAGAALGLLVAMFSLGLVLDQLPASMLVRSMNDVDLDARALWFTAGAFSQCRIYSKYLARQIKAVELGINSGSDPCG